MLDTTTWKFPVNLPLEAQNAGLFISQGRGKHPERIIDSCELIFVREGQLGMFEEEQRFDLSAGQSLLLWPGRRHGGTRAYPPDLHFYWLHFSVTPEEHAQDNLMLPQCATVRRPDRLTAYFRAFLDDQEHGQAHPLSANLLVMLILAEVAQTMNEHGEIGGMRAVLAQRAQAFIQLHFAEPISTSTIAHALDVNPDYLGRTYTSVYGMTVMEAIHRRRLYHARTLLLDSGASVELIARQCGFADAGYFRRVFQRYEGMAPLAYRRLYARLHINSL